MNTYNKEDLENGMLINLTRELDKYFDYDQYELDYERQYRRAVWHNEMVHLLDQGRDDYE